MRHDELSSIFPEFLRTTMEAWKIDTENLQEIRIRAERPVLALCGNREYRSKTAVKKAQLQEILAYLSGYSLYAYEDEIRQGYLSLPGGHRVGIAGRAVVERGKIRTVTDVSSLNIRFAHEVKGCADRLLPWIRKEDGLLHTLIVSAPGHGKTTLLRDCIRQVSDGEPGYPGLTVGVVDERSEIAGGFRGGPGNDVGLRRDVLDGCPKAEGMMMLIRSMAAKAAAVAEIGSRDDMDALTLAVNCGCVVVATVHGSSMEELKRKPVLREMVETGIFERYVFLKASGKPGRLHRILDASGRPVGQGEEGC